MRKLNKIALLLSLFFISHLAIAQSQISVQGVTACPNQVMTLTAVWNNVSNITYTLFNPPPGIPVGPTFTLVSTSQTAATINYTIIGTGNSNLGVVTSTAYFSFVVQPPAAMSITNTMNYCYGDNATLICPSGGISYSVASSACYNGVSSSNIVTFPLNSPNCSGQYSVTSYINGCTVKGVTTVNVSPNTQITINTASSVCQGGNVILAASLPNSSGWQWLHNNVPIPASVNSPTYITPPLTINDAGVYTATANLAFNGLDCPRTASTVVNVVQTSPVVASASPSNEICQGTNLTLSGNTSVPANAWTWNGPASFFSTQQAPVISLANPLHSGTYTVAALFIGSSITCSQTAVVSVNVVGVTQPVITMPANICQGGNVTMSATAGPNATYEWLGPCLPSGTFGQSAAITGALPNCSGTYYVNAKFTSPNNTQCIATSSAVLNVVPVSTVSVIQPGQLCSPSNVNLQANSFGANAYSWLGPNNFSTPGANVIVYYATPTANGIYTVTAYFGGAGLTCTNSNTLSVTVSPVLNFTLMPRQQKCYGEPVTILGPTGATSYTWTSSTGFKSNDRDINFTSIQPKNAGTYTLNVSLGPCVTSGETVIDVLSPISLTLVPSNKTICLGDTVILEGGATSGSENYAYSWNPPVYLDSPNGPRKVVAPQGTVLYNLTVHDIACPNFTVSHSFSIVVNRPPETKFELSRGNGCTPFCMFLDSKSNGESAITTYDFGGLQQMQGDKFTYCINEAGTYYLQIYSKGKNGCSGTFIYPYPIVVNQGPGTDFITEPEKPTTTDDITFRSFSTYSPLIKHQWMFAGGIDPTDTSAVTIKPPGSDTTDVLEPVRLYNQPGEYPVMLITSTDYGCVDTVIKYVKVIDDFQLYIPNSFTPNGDGVNDVFKVKGMGIKTENYSLQIVDRWGDLVFSTTDIDEGWDGKYNGVTCRDGSYVYYVKAVGANGEGRKEVSGYVILLK